MGNSGAVLKSHLSLLAANILFGMNYSFYSSIIGHILTSNQLFFVRIAFSALFFVPLMFITGKWKIDIRDYYKFALIGIVIVFGRIYLMLFGMNYTSPIDGSIIATMNPILIMIFSAFLVKEKITVKRTFGILLGLAGAVILIISDSSGHGLHGGKMLGNILILISILFSAFNTVFTKKFIAKYSPVTVLGWAMLTGAVISIPIFWHDIAVVDTTHWNTGMWLELGYITILGTITATALAYFPLRTVSATSASMYVYSQPIIATILAVLRGQDKISLIMIVSAVLIFSGVFMVIFSYKQDAKGAVVKPTHSGLTIE